MFFGEKNIIHFWSISGRNIAMILAIFRTAACIIFSRVHGSDAIIHNEDHSGNLQEITTRPGKRLQFANWFFDGP